VSLQPLGLDSGCVATLTGALADAGVRVTPPAEALALLVVFARADEEVLRTVRAEAGAGRGPVLALGLHPGTFSAEDAWRLLGAGAADAYRWTGTEGAAIRERVERWADVEAIVRSDLVSLNLVGRSPSWIRELRAICEIARFTPCSVLLQGESGTGKELAARLVHSLDPAAEQRELVIVDCSTLVPELSGSEFFGHERGAFTNAHATREGAFERANGGTLFLDEIGELPLQLQAQLLRVVQERTFKRIGGNEWHRTAFRLVSASNRDLLAEVEAGRFRADLYHRIAAWTCRLPPLRERPDDVLLLAEHFLSELGVRCSGFDEPVKQHLLSRRYPGNVRELRQVVERLGRRHVGSGCITVGDVPPEDRPALERTDDWRGADLEGAIRRALAAGAGLKEIGREASEAAIRLAIGQEKGNLQRAARVLGVTDRALQLRRQGAAPTGLA
jgi:transcriptional regulator with GAF, ATPase, and Fis domain